MSVPLLRLGNNFNFHISGDVNIHETAVIAPGVILQAAANSKIIIGPGVCIGMGSILQVNEGILEIEAGANLGAGFLMVGQGKIGANACIGAATTVFNCSVASSQVIQSGSILGDNSRQIDENQNQQVVETAYDTTVTNTSEPEPEPEPEPEKLQEKEEKVIKSSQFSAAAFVDFQEQCTSVPASSPTPKSQSPPVTETPLVTNSAPTETTLPGSQTTNTEETESSPANTESSQIFGTQIYGQGSINRLLSTLFPHRQPLNNQNSENSSE